MMALTFSRRDAVVTGLSCLGAALVCPRPANALAYPERPLRLIVPFSAGGVVDVLGRLWGERVKQSLHTVVVENHGGGGGTIGAAEAARAQPDGYTLLLGNTSTQILNPALMSRPPYDPAAFRAVSILANSAVSIAVSSQIPVRSLPELIDYIQKNPGKMSYGSPGTGTFTHLAGEMFKQLSESRDVHHVPYRGAGPGISDLVSGHIPMMMLNITNQVIELHRANKIRIVTVLSPKRLSALPDVPAATETVAGLVAVLFTGLFMPAGTPNEIVERVAQASGEAMSGGDFRQKLIEMGFDPLGDTPAEAQRFIDAERERLLPLVRSIGFKLD
jgi:tripartite-type tricarboxylate transporter receptor subunit TctC